MKKNESFRTDYVAKQNHVRWKRKIIGIFGILSVLCSYSVVAAAGVNTVISSPIGVQQEISGAVSDDQGAPLPGVSVVEVGTANGTVTDFDGNYVITVNEGSVLEFSYLGMESKQVTVTADNTINVTLATSSSELDEVVVIGYGTRKKKDLTGAVSVITSEELLKEVKMSPELAMQGKMAGVFISNPGANPNTRPTIRIRGVGTIGFNDPLYVIDGVPVTEGLASSNTSRDRDIRGGTNIMNLINPNDIESISVLKDASATAIYGVRASNGVILIQTKRGKAGKTRVTFSQSYGVQNLRKRYDVLNTSDYVALHNEAWDNNPSADRAGNYGALYDSTSPDYLGNNGTYNWIDEAVSSSASVQDYNIGISGGSDKSNFAVSVGYSNQESVLHSTDFERYSFSINSDHKVGKWLKVGQSYRMALSNTNNEHKVVTSDFFKNTVLVSPWQPLYDGSANGLALPGRDIGGAFNPRGYGNSTRENFLGRAPFTTDRRVLFRNLGSFYAELTPIKNVRLRGTVSVDNFTNKQETLLLPEHSIYDAQSGALDPTGSNYVNRGTENLSLVKEFLIGYTNSFGKHNLDLIVNAMDQKTYLTFGGIGAKGSGISSFEQRNIREGDNVVSLERQRKGLLGYMGRLSYNFDSKYYIDGTIRRDGSSVFGPGYKWGTFPAIGLAWRVSSEKFMENSKLFNDLKFRAGWGETGNQETRAFGYLSSVNHNPAYGAGGIIHPAIALGDFPILDTSWETVISKNIGFDATLLDHKLTITAEYYERNTDGILQEISIPQIIGALNSPVVNLAKVENSGVEFQLGFNDQFGELGFNASFNLTTVKTGLLNYITTDRRT